VADALHHGVEIAGDAGDVVVIEVTADGLREVTGLGSRDDLVELALEIFHHLGAGSSAHGVGLFFGAHIGDADAVFLEHLHGRGHLADFVLARGAGNFGFELAIGEVAHGQRQLPDRAAHLPGAHIERAGRAGSNPEACRQQEHGLHGRLEAGDLVLDAGKPLDIGGDNSVDLGLEGLAVGPVLFVIALLIGECRVDIAAEVRGFGAESAEFSRPRHHCLKARQVCGGKKRPPALENIVDIVEVRHDPVGELGSRSRIRRGVDTARVHHHGGDETVQLFARESPLGRIVQPLDLLAVFPDDVKPHACDEGRD
jgi:hypothetical protein